jgi:hypothetical protein
LSLGRDFSEVHRISPDDCGRLYSFAVWIKIIAQTPHKYYYLLSQVRPSTVAVPRIRLLRLVA